MPPEPVPSKSERLVGRYRLMFEVFNVAAYSEEDAEHLARLYLDRIKSLAAEADALIVGVEEQA